LRSLFRFIRPQAPDEQRPFLAPRSPAATVLAATLLMLAEGPLKRWEQSQQELPYPDTPAHYWQNVLHDMFWHPVIIGGVTGTVDLIDRRAERRVLHLSRDGRVVFSRFNTTALQAFDIRKALKGLDGKSILDAVKRPLGTDLARVWWGRPGSVELAAEAWAAPRAALMAALWAAVAKGATEAFLNPPPGRVGDGIREASAALEGLE